MAQQRGVGRGTVLNSRGMELCGGVWQSSGEGIAM